MSSTKWPSVFDDVFSFWLEPSILEEIKVGFNPFTQACLLDAKVKHQVVVPADSTIDIEVDSKLHILMKHETKNKDMVAKINQ